MQSLPYNPIIVNNNGLGYSRFARRYLGNRKNLLPDFNGSSPKTWSFSQKESSVFCFLFLQVLKCFTSLGTLRLTSVPAVSRRVSPFRDFRVEGWLAPRRNFSQPFHVFHRSFKPRHPPYTLTFLQGMLYTDKSDTTFFAWTFVHRCTIFWVSPADTYCGHFVCV